MDFLAPVHEFMFSFGHLRIAPIYLISTFLIGFFVFLVVGGHRREQSFLKWLLPKAIYFHPSHITDIKLFLINRASAAVGLFGALGLQAVMAMSMVALLTKLTGGELISGSWTPDQIALVTFVMLVASDFCVYWIHRIHHEMPILWPFHSVHHSAEVMTPITVYRKHPVYDVIASFVRASLLGVVLGIIIFCLTDTYSEMHIAGVSVFYFAFNLLGSNFRHSHIWLGYGKHLSHILISPAQHQIHHSVAVEHHNKNYGEVLAVWDWMFGTLYVPQCREELRFGIGDEQGELIEQPHGSLTDALAVPFEESWRAAKVRIGIAAKPVSGPPELTEQ